MRPKIHNVVLAAFSAYSTDDVFYLLPTYAATLVTKWGTTQPRKRLPKVEKK